MTEKFMNVNKILPSHYSFSVCPGGDIFAAVMTRNHTQQMPRWLFILWAGGTALLSYSLVYALRKPFTAAGFDGMTFWGIDYKVAVSIVQLVGYAASKLLGIKYISELRPEGRLRFIIGSAALSEISLVMFGLLPVPYNILALFFNGMSLGCMWGVIFSFLEGRRVTDLLASIMGVSMALSSGLAKSLGLYTLNTLHVSEFWMPALIGAVAFPLLCLTGWTLTRLPAPTAEDIASRSVRATLDSRGRMELFRRFMPLLILLFVANGAYGKRMGVIADYIGIDYRMLSFEETTQADPSKIDSYLNEHPEVTHVSVVHCETTTGILNPLEDIARVVKGHGKTLIVDAMSSFGGVPIDMAGLGIDFMISSANKCVQGVPGFGFVIARRSELAKCAGVSRSLSLDLYDQWETMEKGHGKWRFTSPTHVVRAFMQALKELEDEGGIQARNARYRANHDTLVSGMRALGFQTLLPDEVQSPIITSFLYPSEDFDFKLLYQALKAKGFVIYPGKISQADTFRIGNIGDVFPDDFKRLTEVIASLRR